MNVYIVYDVIQTDYDDDGLKFYLEIHGGARYTVQSTIRYDTRCYFNVRSKSDISQLNLPHGTDN